MTQQNMVVDEFDLMSDAPEIQTAFKNYGKLTITLHPMAWRDGKTVEVTSAEWAALPAKDSAGKGAKQIDCEFAVDVQEFRPQLGFSYSRKATVGGADWNKIIAPSIEAITTKGSMSKENRNATLRNLNGKYVAVEDVPQTPRVKKDANGNIIPVDPNAKQYNTVKFVKLYPSREACYADSGAANTNGADAGGFDNTVSTQNPDVPTGFDAESWAAVKADVQVKVAECETPLIEALNAKNAKLPKPAQKKALDAATPAMHTQAIAEAAAKLSAEWDVEVKPEHIAKLLGA